MPLRVGDAVLAYINEQCQRIGVIQYIGKLNNHDIKRVVGVNLVEVIEDGHDGCINGVSYFQAPHGHGVFLQVQNIIKKLSPSEVILQMQQMATLFKKRLNEYTAALSGRDDYINDLKSAIFRLRNKLNSQRHHNNLFRTMKELAPTPPPMNRSNGYTVKKKQKKKKKKFKNEYTKYSVSKKAKVRHQKSLSEGSAEWSDHNDGSSYGSCSSDTEDDSNSNSGSDLDASPRKPSERDQKQQSPRDREPHEQKQQIFVHNTSQTRSPYHLSPGQYPMVQIASSNTHYYKNIQQFRDMTQHHQQYAQHRSPIPQPRRSMQQKRLSLQAAPPTPIMSSLVPQLRRKRSNSVDMGQYNMYNAQRRNEVNNLNPQWAPQQRQQQQRTYLVPNHSYPKVQLRSSGHTQ